ncbi:MAG: hypothetical protein HOQ07_05530 [Sinomonas sp.]|jgi:hypothetical protein|nr:hypothetical protein [Sinomonas sp.]
MQELIAADVAAEHAELLPQRDTMLFDINVAPVIAVNLAIAVNAATIGSTASATALQMVGVLQH